MAAKILIAGDVNGCFAELLKRVETVNKKAGPFDALFCVGRFFAPGNAEGDVPALLAECISGEKCPAVPIYFNGSGGEGSAATLAALEGADCSISYLGRAGVKQVKGLTVAFLDDGLAKAGKQQGLSELVAHLKKDLAKLSVDVDLLLTCAWPSNVTHGVPSVDGLDDGSGSEAIADIAQAARPRYHVAGTRGPFYARAPYVNSDLGAGSHVTRFLSCGAVGNTVKAKWLHALGLKPAASMAVEELQLQPPDSTPSPYVGARKRAGEQGLGEQSWRWQENKKARHAAPSNGRPGVVIDTSLSIYVKNLPFSTTEDELVDFFSKAGKVVDVRRTLNSEGKLHGWAHIQFERPEAVEAACGMSGQTLLGRELTIDLATGTEKAKLNLGKPVPDCWFCLSNAQADVQLVVDVLEDVYLAIDKGPINDMHVLIVPVEHYPNMITLKPAAYVELEDMTGALKRAYASKGLEMVGFERYLGLHSRGGNHAHINFIGISRDAAKRAQAAFERTASKYQFSFQHFPAGSGEASRQSVAQLVGDQQYFQVFLPDGSRLVHVISRDQKHPMHFGREVLALLAGVPDRSDWRQCKARDEAEEEARGAEFRQFFEPFSPNSTKS